MGLKGDLSTMGLEDILQWLAVGKKTGILELKGFLHTKRVAFHEGRITSVWSSDPREYLGQYLLAFNRITEEQLREALATQEDENQLLGRILVNRQLVTEVEIRRIVQLKVEESIFDTFLWAMGTFEFHDGQPPLQKSMLLSLDVTGIVLEGARRMDEWKRIRFLIKGGDAILAAIPEAIADMLPLAPEDADMLSRLDGYKTIDQLVIEMRVPEFKANKLLFDLHEKGMVSILQPRRQAGRPVQPPAPARPAAGGEAEARGGPGRAAAAAGGAAQAPGGHRACSRWWSTCSRRTRSTNAWCRNWP